MALFSSERGAERFRRGWRVLGCGLAALSLGTSIAPLVAADSLRPLEIKQQYRQVLGVLAGGDRAQALDDLVALELRAVGDERAWRFVDSLWRLKLQVIRDLLADSSPDLLMPIVLLHHDAYFRYAEMEKSYLAQHSRTMSSELAEVYAERAATPRAAAFAGWTLSSFGAFLWSPSNIGGSADLFYRAQAVDGGNLLALKGLALAHERAGEYEQSLEYLRRALAAEPGDPELLLRRALCQLRLERSVSEASLEALAGLIEEGTPDWIRSVAYQEMTRAYLEAGDSGKAGEIARQGLEALPGDQQISLQLAAVLDGERRRNESLAVLEAIRVAGWGEDSPRLIYDFWMPPDLERMRDDLHQEADKGLAALSRSLAGVAIPGESP